MARPGLFGRLGAARVTVVSAPAGSGKTVLLRSWISHAGLGDCAAFVAVGWDPQRFWPSVVGALQAAAGRALEHALDLAEPDGALLPFLLHPVPGLLERQARHHTAHAALIAEILGLLAGNSPSPPPARPRLPIEPLSESELRVLRYLPTNLTAPEIAGELYVSFNTVKIHMRSLYAKLGTHRRAETVARARDLGLLAPSARKLSSGREERLGRGEGSVRRLTRPEGAISQNEIG